jgi:hypothetical protein
MLDIRNIGCPHVCVTRLYGCPHLYLFIYLSGNKNYDIFSIQRLKKTSWIE